ncbi:hypothetical protein [Microbacterium pumilum]|uniref:Uncharacterized protein n=1 Tax=Microbacterium pumilum TaxID=344165 RepID=A0ABN2S8F1_9MICO
MTDPADEDTARVPRPGRRDSGDDGSTVVARRESRRRQERAGADRTPEPDDDRVGASSQGRVARTPDSTPAVSAVRAPAPVVVPRTPREAREPQTPVDTVAAEASRRRRTRRITAIVVASASVVVVLAATALFVLVIAG